jgi:sec-independent protein translocase protein TatA
MYNPPLLLFSGVGWLEILLIIIVILLLFGAKRLPDVMRSLGIGVKEFKKGMKEVSRELEEEEEGEKDDFRPPEGPERKEGEKSSHGEGA